MDIPNFPECDHAVVKSLFEYSDYDLVQHLKQHPDEGKYFTALFCRYSPVVYTLIRHSARSMVQSEYLFTLTWRHILYELSGLDLPPDPPVDFSLQAWLVNLTAACINQAALPDVEEIHYNLQEASPPLWCYVTQALERLQPLHRLVIIMAQTFRWSNTRIAAYLQAEGQRISPKSVSVLLADAQQSLNSALPSDIQAIYFGDTDTVTEEDLAEELADLLDVSDLELDKPNLSSEA
ncbi:RNA polymerase sigma factor [Leptothoe spongobia]|uniref:Sigma-70 family RNA polymerase sigma factor n=1 Tax=Leptothoe spongobia TAU-MAC 1115 TaxID=1967444 RepID=A0A947DDE5_9CYAN|nr:sigma-70 family RNA polymerase sigma factor [Leptothoe spongobia]MBT9314956.1 sigma-70 family RNA polymerase sigma factor [Leptothoe spongobia TAU-MAC 1115]